MELLCRGFTWSSCAEPSVPLASDSPPQKIFVFFSRYNQPISIVFCLRLISIVIVQPIIYPDYIWAHCSTTAEIRRLMGWTSGRAAPACQKKGLMYGSIRPNSWRSDPDAAESGLMPLFSPVWFRKRISSPDDDMASNKTGRLCSVKPTHPPAQCSCFLHLLSLGDSFSFQSRQKEVKN